VSPCKPAARLTELTAADLPGRFAAIPELADRNALAKAGVIAIAEVPYPPEFSGQVEPVERLGYLTSLFNCLHHQIEHSGAGAVGAVVRESDIRAWGTGLPSCNVYDSDAAAPRLFILRSA
jgi:hypothetical protein